MECEEEKDLLPIVGAKRYTIHSPVPISSEESTTEDTAPCLILLAQGHFSPDTNPPKAACFIYACKTCNRSFQALGGHRASHKKPKNERKSLHQDHFPSPSSFSSSKKTMPSDYLSLQLNHFPTAAPKQPAPSPRIHTCVHCGMEFASGQALGGHMRRHRAGLVISPPSNPNTCIYVEEHDHPPSSDRGR